MAALPTSQSYSEDWYIFAKQLIADDPLKCLRKKISVSLTESSSKDSKKLYPIIKNILENLADHLSKRKDVNTEILELIITPNREGFYDISMQHPDDDMSTIICDISAHKLKALSGSFFKTEKEVDIAYCAISAYQHATQSFKRT
jgi:hypothetical protein